MAAALLLDDKGNAHPYVGTGSDFWSRRTNVRPGCKCPGWRYNPREEPPISRDCPKHGHLAKK